MANVLTREQIESRLVYDHATGFLYWKATGKRADHFQGRYRRVSWDYKKYYAHHIIWCLFCNEWPAQIDHRNGDCEDNRLENLRVSDSSQNQANSVRSKLRGIERHGAKWRVRIWINYKRVELGSYKTKEEAIAVYQAAADKYWGNYAQHNRVS